MVIFCFQNIEKNSNAIKSISRNGVTFTATKCDNSTFTFTQQDNNTTYANYKGATTAAIGTAGLVPAASTTNRLKFLRGDATWQVPTDTTYANYKGATTADAGTHGLVPPATTATRLRFLRGDATWQVPTDTTYGAATNSALGLVKTGSNITNSSGTISLTKANVTAALGYTPPTTNTTYDLSFTSQKDATLNTTYCTAGGGFRYSKQKCNGKFITTIAFDVEFKGTYSSDDVAIIGSGLPAPAMVGLVFLCRGESRVGTSYEQIHGAVTIDSQGRLKPWYCGNVNGHWFGSFTYISN